MEVNLPHALHGAEEIAELLVDLTNQRLERVQPALFSLRPRQRQRPLPHEAAYRARSDILMGRKKIIQIKST